MHLASSCNAEGIGGVGLADAERYVLQQLFEKPVAELTGGDELAFSAGERRIVYREGHLNGRLTDLNEGQCLKMTVLANGIADRYVFKTADTYYISGSCSLAGNAVQTLYLVYGDDLSAVFLLAVVVVAYRYFLIDLDASALDTSDSDASNVVVVVYGRNKVLHGTLVLGFGCGHIAQYLVEQGSKVGAGNVGIHRSRAVAPRAVEYRAVELFVGSVKIHEKLKHLVAYLVKTGVGTVYLVYYDDYLVTELKSLLQYKTRLRHGTLGGVNEEYNAVDHFEHALDLAAEIGVSGGVDYVYLYVFVFNGSILCEYRYTPFALYVAGVHNAFLDLLIVAECSGLLQHLVNERGLAVVYVCDYRYVAKVFSYHINLSLSHTYA